MRCRRSTASYLIDGDFEPKNDTECINKRQELTDDDPRIQTLVGPLRTRRKGFESLRAKKMEKVRDARLGQIRLFASLGNQQYFGIVCL